MTWSRSPLWCSLAQALLVLGLTWLAPALARAEDSTVQSARDDYKRGLDLSAASQWGEALSAFEVSSTKRPHAQTLYNMGSCERALGRWTRARARFEESLKRAEGNPTELPASVAEEVRGLLREYERILPRINVTLEPADTNLAIDGRPLHVDPAREALVAGLATPGLGKPVGRATFVVELDPGTHVFALSRAGYADVVISKQIAASARMSLNLNLEMLPATLRISADQQGALVRVNEADVGPAPVELLRPRGLYKVVVSKSGYTPFVNDVSARSGQEVSLRAQLALEKTPITKRWWFWTGAAAVLAGAAVLTYVATRPTPEPPPYDGGNTNWVVVPK
jgi:PEGA domain